MPKKVKMPKKPRAGASLATWQRWEKRKKEAIAKNNKIEAEKKAKAKIIERNRG